MNLIEDFQTRIDARMAEIRPLVQEYHALQQLRSVMTNLDPEAVIAHIADFPIPGISGGPGAKRALTEALDNVTQLNAERKGGTTAPKRTTAAGKRRNRSAASERRAATDKDEQPVIDVDTGQESRIVELVSAEPGMTAAQLAARLELPVSVLFRTLPLLQRDGLVRKQGKGFSGA